MTVAFLDVQASYAELKAEVDAAVRSVLDGGWYIGGDHVSRFEADYAAYCSAQCCIGVGNGLDALCLILKALDIGPGDEVIVPAHTFIATWLAVTECGATIVPVEPDPSTWNIDVAAVERAITDRTRAVIPVHLYGQPADLEPLTACARRHGLKVIEDAAQAQGARYRGQRIGAHGDAVAWSFYPGKNLGAFGDAGAVTTDDRDLAERIRVMSNYGSIRKYEHVLRGRNSRLDPIQAAVLSVKLTHLDAWNARRASVAAFYQDRLAGSGVTLPRVLEDVAPVWHLFVVATPDRDDLQRTLSQGGVQTVIHYPTPPHLQPAYDGLGYGVGSFPIAEALARSVVSLPIGPHLRLDDAAVVGDAVRRWAEGRH